ncbi:MAG: MFS transporter [Rickettsia endosymbiont of Ixodes persulcatus]|nr:MFS transporter [Rickettsia endosymbiont of Ixodes persulcatus]MCZ6902331.1 MFS transporter [Rickettsia endosymbiont of Ixodes persulcatus]MCZ6903366.1 MFS transporter [Rickettsia endosymbiont of Ixodes persulcatus]MCZ6908660.1 MFS transporter [Rickettsia endosymbiont of Ixodes persulcatus]MCZ6910779.1 MFS transporter [Rickettsia endosymbiont of Ixodes persulcatus]
MNNSLSKRDFSILIGNAMDHFDTALYGFLAPLLAGIFFPNHDKVVALILTYSVLATSLFTRLIGSYFFGVIAKKYGGVFALSHSLIGVALSTALIGLIPSHAQIGWLAPLLLVVLRTLQGVYSEGECAIAKLYILENKDETKAFKASYLYQTSTMVGIILASFISTIVLNVDYNEYWCLCFIFGGFSALVGYFLRKSDSIRVSPSLSSRTSLSFRDLIAESSKNLKKTNIISYFLDPVVKPQGDNKGFWIPAFAGMTFLHDLVTIWNSKLSILRVSFAVGFSYMTYIVPFVFMNSFIPLITDIPLETMMKFNTEFLIFDMVMILIIGHLTKKLHYLKILSGTLILMSLSTIPLWLFLNNSSIWYVNFVRIWIIVLGVNFLAPLNCWLNDLFKTADKYMLVGIGSSIGSSLIGRLAPSTCLMLWHVTGSSLSIAVYITVISAITLWAVVVRS